MATISRGIRVVVLSGPDRARELVLERGTYQVGKGVDCDLRLKDTSVSRRHLEIAVQSDGVLVKDLQSKNGTFFQGARISEVLVAPGAIVTIGDTELRFMLVEDPSGILPSSQDHFGALYGGSVAMRQVFSTLERMAASNAPVLVNGETGTGKELCAEAIHSASGRARGPFVICDLASISRGLIESELFGHKRGAFTGADHDREGAFVLAHGGTIFLDEVGELDLDMQPRLLRAIEQSRVKPVGASNYQKVDVRIIAATNRDLKEECRAGRFRTDLYHRIAVLTVKLPPLRDRKEDLPLLIEKLFSRQQLSLSGEDAALLGEYDWPGNVRELKNVLERALAMRGPGESLTRALLGLDMVAPPSSGGSGFREIKEQLIAAWERRYLTDLLRRADGNVAKAAIEGGLDRPYLYRLLKKHGLGPGEEPR